MTTAIQGEFFTAVENIMRTADPDTRHRVAAAIFDIAFSRKPTMTPVTASITSIDAYPVLGTETLVAVVSAAHDRGDIKTENLPEGAAKQYFDSLESLRASFQKRLQGFTPPPAPI